jgi:hypothetical protein
MAENVFSALGSPVSAVFLVVETHVAHAEVVRLNRTVCVLIVQPETDKSGNDLSYLPCWVPTLLMEV